MVVELPRRIDIDREVDARFVDECLCPVCVAVADRDQLCPPGFDVVLAFCQASRLLAAEYSAEVTEERDDSLAAVEDGFELDDLVVEGLDRKQLS